MSQAEKGRWIMLIGKAVILVFVVVVMIHDGQVVQFPGPALLGIFIPVALFATVFFSVAFGVAAVYRVLSGESMPDDRHDGFEMDERDRDILGRARRNALVFLQTALAVILYFLIANAVLSADWPLHPRIESRADWVFTLFLLFSLTELVQDGSAIVYYRR